MLFRSYGDHRDLHKEGHSFPTRRSSDLLDDCVAVGVVLAGHEASALGIDVGVAIIVAAGAVEALAFGGGVVGIGLAVGDEAENGAVSSCAPAEGVVRSTGSFDLAMRLSSPWTTCW